MESEVTAKPTKCVFHSSIIQGTERNSQTCLRFDEAKKKGDSRSPLRKLIERPELVLGVQGDGPGDHGPGDEYHRENDQDWPLRVGVQHRDLV